MVGELRSSLEVTCTQGIPHIVEFVRIVQGEVRWPACFTLHNADLDFCDKVAGAHEPLGQFGVHALLDRKSVV